MFVLFPGSALKMKTNPKQFEYVEKEKRKLLNYEKNYNYGNKCAQIGDKSKNLSKWRE